MSGKEPVYLVLLILAAVIIWLMIGMCRSALRIIQSPDAGTRPRALAVIALVLVAFAAVVVPYYTWVRLAPS